MLTRAKNKKSKPVESDPKNVSGHRGKSSTEAKQNTEQNELLSAGLNVSRLKSSRSVKVRKTSRNVTVSSSSPQPLKNSSNRGKIMRRRLNAESVPEVPKRKRKSSDKGRTAPAATKRSRRTVESKAVPEVDPYALTPDKSGGPAHTIPIASAAPLSDGVANDRSSAVTTKKGKFFTLGRETASRHTSIETFESLKQKLPALSRRARRPPKSQTARAREEERARIMATTIWLPVPPQVQKILQQQQQSQPTPGPSATPSFAGAATPAPPGPLPTPREGDDSIPLSTKPTIRMSDLSSMISPIARNPPSPPPQLESTAVMNAGSALFKDGPLTDTSNLSHRPSWRGEQAKGGVARRISFAQPLSPIRKRSSAGSKGSSSHSLSASKIPLKNDTRNQDASEYEDFLEKLNSQLKPYEDFELTID